MPTDACLFFRVQQLRVLLRPKSNDYCVFCSYGSVMPAMEQRLLRLTVAARKAPVTLMGQVARRRLATAPQRRAIAPSTTAIGTTRYDRSWPVAGIDAI
jgi:hypothetical protein